MYPKDKSDPIPGYFRVPLGKLCMNEQAKTSAQMMLCDDWNHRSVEKAGSGSSLLENHVQTVWPFFCDSSYSGAAWPVHSFSWRQACSSPQPFFFLLQDLRNDGYGWIRHGLLIKKHIKEITVSYNWTQTLQVVFFFAVIWNKQPASGMAFRTVFRQWFLERRKADSILM